MSKKLAEGIDSLVLDVKFGSGAFMKTLEDALELAETLVTVGEHFGKQTIAYLTDMNQPLGFAVGNWLEAVESFNALKGEGPEDVMEITHTLAGTMIFLGDKASSIREGIEKSRDAIRNGQALEKWLKLVEEQGGDSGFLRNPNRYPQTAHQFEFKAPKDGYLEELDAYKIGLASLELGAGRRRKEDTIDPAAGIQLEKKIGDYVDKNETIARGFTNNDAVIDSVLQTLSESVSISDGRPRVQGLIQYRADAEGVHSVKS